MTHLAQKKLYSILYKNPLKMFQDWHLVCQSDNYRCGLDFQTRWFLEDMFPTLDMPCPLAFFDLTPTNQTINFPQRMFLVVFT